jgi:chorismate synthase
LTGNSIGRRLVLTSIGESHGKCIGTVLDGCPAGLDLTEKDIQKMLDLRKPGQSLVSTQRKEDDKVEIISGTFRGSTTGAPITMIIWNKDQKSTDYEKLTATHVMGGAIARKLIKEQLGVETNSYTCQIGKMRVEEEVNKKMLKTIYSNVVRCPSKTTAKKMERAILTARKNGDSLGGIIESVSTNIPAGLGEPIFGSLESDISRAIFSIPAVKGVEFGSGFAGSEKFGSENNDPYVIKNGKILTKTNNSGGILGGISNGMPIVFRVAFKPASSIAKYQDSVNVKTKKKIKLQVGGRHDPCVVPRAPPVVDSLVALTLADHALISGFIKPTL